MQNHYDNLKKKKIIIIYFLNFFKKFLFYLAFHLVSVVTPTLSLKMYLVKTKE